MSDIVTRFCDALREALKHYEPGMEEELAAQLERQLRLEHQGERVCVAKRELRGEALREEIRRRCNGRNIDEVADEMGVHPATVYRAIRYRRP